MTTLDAQRGALEAIDRILNRGGAPEEVLAAVSRVLEGLYGAASITASGDVVAPAPDGDRVFLDRVELVISAAVAAAGARR